MNKTIIGSLAGALLLVGLGLGLLVQQKRNAELTRKISELQNQILALVETGAARDAFFDSIQAELTRVSEAQGQLKAEHDAVAATIAMVNTAARAPQTQSTNQASILARLPHLTAEAYRLASGGVGPVQRNPLSGIPVHTITESQFMSLPPLLRQQYMAQAERRAAMIAAERARIAANAQFWLEQKLREMGADNQTIESAKQAYKRYNDSLNQNAALSAQHRAALAIEQQAEAQRAAAQAQEDTASAIRQQNLSKTLENLTPKNVRIVP